MDIANATTWPGRKNSDEKNKDDGDAGEGRWQIKKPRRRNCQMGIGPPELSEMPGDLMPVEQRAIREVGRDISQKTREARYGNHGIGDICASVHRDAHSDGGCAYAV